MRRKAMSKVQARVMRILRKGGTVRQHITQRGRHCFRVMDVKQSPVMNVQRRTIRKLLDSERIIQEGVVYISNPITRLTTKPDIQ